MVSQRMSLVVLTLLVTATAGQPVRENVDLKVPYKLPLEEKAIRKDALLKKELLNEKSDLSKPTKGLTLPPKKSLTLERRGLQQLLTGSVGCCSAPWCGKGWCDCCGEESKDLTAPEGGAAELTAPALTTGLTTPDLTAPDALTTGLTARASKQLTAPEGAAGLTKGAVELTQPSGAAGLTKGAVELTQPEDFGFTKQLTKDTGNRRLLA